MIRIFRLSPDLKEVIRRLQILLMANMHDSVQVESAWHETALSAHVSPTHLQSQASTTHSAQYSFVSRSYRTFNLK